MQKVLLSITLALLMALAVVGVQHAYAASSHSGTILIAEGGMPAPPCSPHEGGMPAPPTAHEGGMPAPPTSF